MQMVHRVREYIVIENAHQPRHDEVHGEQFRAPGGVPGNGGIEPGYAWIRVLHVKRESIVYFEHEERKRKPQKQCPDGAEVDGVVGRCGENRQQPRCVNAQ